MCKTTLLAEQRLADNEFDEEAGEYAAALLVGLHIYKDDLCSDIAMAASLTDSVSWAKDTLMNVHICKPKLFEYIKTFALQCEKESGLAPRAGEQFMVYSDFEGIFATAVVKTDTGKLSARRFFEKYDASISDFACVALHLASKGCGSGDAERSNKETTFIYSKARNRIGPTKREAAATLRHDGPRRGQPARRDREARRP